jgi:phosphoribosylformylglycinamidine cyclo-ligase
MARTFNCGIGMVAIVYRDAAAEACRVLEAAGETVFEIGEVVEGERGCTVFGAADTWFGREAWSASFHG